jgi:lantibiotic modifying enzyme
VRDILPVDWLIDRALTLGERLRCARRSGGIGHRTGRRIAAQRIDTCRRWFNPNGSNSSAWREFLGDVGVDESILWELAEADYTPKGYPGWTTTLRRLLERLETRCSSLEGRVAAVETLSRPVVRFAWDELRGIVSEKQLRLLSRAAAAQLRHALLARLVHSAKQVAQWESELVSYDQFFADGVESAIIRVLWRYPALARLWAMQIDNWKEAVNEFLAHAASLIRIRSANRPGQCPVRTLIPDLSDLHAGNRAVFRIGLNDGSTWFFKSRPADHEAAWFALLGWLNQEGFQCSFRCPRIVSNSDHCWVEAISHRPCKNRTEVHEFFFRAGALLYLAHLLRFVDLHAGNVIAQGEHPVFIDCETLLHPNVRTPKFARQQERSVLRTGLLPLATGDGHIRDSVSGYGRRSAGAHLVHLRNEPIFANAFVDKIISGFVAMHTFLGSGRHDSFLTVASRHLPTQCRQIRKPTGLYHLILDRSLAPRMMISGFDRSLFLHAACRDGIVPRPLVTREVAALESADIPRLSGRATQTRNLPTSAMIRQSLRLIRTAFRIR